MSTYGAGAGANPPKYEPSESRSMTASELEEFANAEPDLGAGYPDPVMQVQRLQTHRGAPGNPSQPLRGPGDHTPPNSSRRGCTPHRSKAR